MNCYIITASFGQLLQFYIDRVKVDISINKVLEPYNSKLLYSYAISDKRFHMLALYLKDWNKRLIKKNVEMRNGKCLNSFSIVLMLIAYLQHKKVLPCLQSFGEN